jgi:hypothetical protein
MGWLAGRRNEVRRLKQRLLGGNVVSIKQEDGTTISIDRMEAFKQTFTYLYESMGADCDAEPRPEPPPVLVAVANAKDRRSALEKVLAAITIFPLTPRRWSSVGSLSP